jgi:hypothetical protein
VWKEKEVAKSDGKEGEANSIDSKKVCSLTLFLSLFYGASKKKSCLCQVKDHGVLGV